jgi:hypothetical protein
VSVAAAFRTRFPSSNLLSQQAEWSEHSRHIRAGAEEDVFALIAIGDAVAGGEMPLLVEAPGLRATLVDVPSVQTV